jgi:hypothetical protein
MRCDVAVVERLLDSTVNFLADDIWWVVLEDLGLRLHRLG